MSDFKDFPDDLKKKLLADHNESKSKENSKAKRSSKKKAPGQCSDKDPGGVMLTAVFGSKMRETICANTCSDANLIDAVLLDNLNEAGAVKEIETLDNLRVFVMAAELPDGTKAEICCNKVATINTELYIRHGTSLTLRNLR